MAVSAMYDMAFILDGDGTVQSVTFDPEFTDERIRGLCRKLVGSRPELEKAVPVDHVHHRITVWDRIFEYRRFAIPGGYCLLVRREPVTEKLMEAALDLSQDAIQLYGAESQIQFFNRACRKMLDIPPADPLRNQKLLDIFDVDDGYSTTLTALRSQNSVANRYDQYKSITGKELLTVNDSTPVFREDGSLLGAVTVERNMEIVKQKMQELRKIQDILASHETKRFAEHPGTRYSFDDIIGSSSALQSAVHLAKQMALKNINILIQGETGSGKELFAQGIHGYSSRKKEKFVAVNCAAFPETLVESMLFGTVKGAFTGSTDKAGLIEEANHGTLFLDEVNSMSLPMQAKLLRVLQEGTLQRIGSTRDIPVDIRVLSSCNEDAFKLVENGKLRRDLFYRLGAVIVEIPPLRERMSDIRELTESFIRTHPDLPVEPIREIKPSFWERLRHHDWPGNVRELFHILSYSLSVCKDGVLDGSHFPDYFLRRSEPEKTAQVAEESSGFFDRGLVKMVREYERQLLRQAYLLCGRNATRTAAMLQISRQNFQYYVKKYHLNQEE